MGQTTLNGYLPFAALVLVVFVSLLCGFLRPPPPPPPPQRRLTDRARRGSQCLALCSPLQAIARGSGFAVSGDPHRPKRHPYTDL